MVETITISRDVTGFTKIDMRGVGNIELAQGRDFAFEMSAESAIIDLITTTVEDETLIIAFEDQLKPIKTSEPITYTITMPVIEGVRISGGGSLNCERVGGKSFALDLPGGSTVNLESVAVVDCQLRVTGGAKVTIDRIQAAKVAMDIPGSLNMTLGTLDADKLHLNIRGTANLTMAGRVITQMMNVTGVANIKAGSLQSDTVTLKSLGMSNIVVWANDMLDVIVNGAGNVKYYGDPKVKKSVNGFGKIRQVGSKPKRAV